jgi:hypothetical protein
LTQAKSFIAETTKLAIKRTTNRQRTPAKMRQMCRGLCVASEIIGDLQQTMQLVMRLLQRIVIIDFFMQQKAYASAPGTLNLYTQKYLPGSLKLPGR